MENSFDRLVEPQPVDVIEPSKSWFDLRLDRVWTYRELLFFLVWRDLKVRYKQSVLGVLWIIIQPVITMIVFTGIFNRFLGVGSGSDIPYPIFVYSALLPWTYFADALARSSVSLVYNARLVSKVYFPRLVIPMAATLPGLVDFTVAFLVLIGMMIYYRYTPSLSILLLPVAMLFATLTALGVGLWLTSINVQYRDIQHVIPFLVQIWMYATPIIYPISRIPDQLRWLYDLNPMVSVVNIFRVVILGDDAMVGVPWLSMIVVFLLLFSGLIYFRRLENTFADKI